MGDHVAGTRMVGTGRLGAVAHATLRGIFTLPGQADNTAFWARFSAYGAGILMEHPDHGETSRDR